ncbi:MAG: tetratricopeptide repeat protein [Xanthomonadaceae bacterium]|nr:tetratricopeptide repeat protein [Xanthomonadaceae bacterium]
MSLFLRRPLTVALTAALGISLLSGAAFAQQKRESMKEADQRARGMSEGKDEAASSTQKGAKATKAPLYPNATRSAPEIKVSPKGSKLLQALQELYEKDDWTAVMTKADEIAALPASNAYEKAFAYSMAGNAAASSDNPAKAEAYFSKAVEADGLDNDGHFSTMYNLAATQFGEERYAEALKTLDRFLAETKSEKAEHQAFRAGILANLDRHEEAAAIYKSLIAKNPDDKRILMNAVAALQNASKFPEANALLEGAYARGMLTESRELRSLYIGYMNEDRWADAQKVIEAGVAKGILQPGPDLARDYQVLAQTAYMDDKLPLAIELYKRAAPMAADGEAYLNLAKVLDMAGKKAEAKTAAQSALDKGVKKPEDAKRILAR